MDGFIMFLEVFSVPIFFVICVLVGLWWDAAEERRVSLLPIKEQLKYFDERLKKDKEEIKKAEEEEKAMRGNTVFAFSFPVFSN